MYFSCAMFSVFKGAIKLREYSWDINSLCRQRPQKLAVVAPFLWHTVELTSRLGCNLLCLSVSPTFPIGPIGSPKPFAKSCHVVDPNIVHVSVLFLIQTTMLKINAQHMA